MFHQEFGAYPSSIRRRFSGLTIPAGLRAYSGLFDGDLDDPRLVSLAELEDLEGELVAESGIECYCEYGEMLYFVEDGADDADDYAFIKELPDDIDDFLRFQVENPDAVVSAVVRRADSDANLGYSVGADEGELFGGPVTLTQIP